MGSQFQLFPLVAAALLAALALPAHAQYRPSYFPRPGGFNQELPQYGGQQAGQGGQGGDGDIGNRDNAPSTLPPLPPPGSNGAGEDTDLANRVTEWPRPHQPFWLLNQQHINQHIGRPGQPAQQQGAQGPQGALDQRGQQGLQGPQQQGPQGFGAAPPARPVSTFLGNRNNNSPYFSG